MVNSRGDGPLKEQIISKITMIFIMHASSTSSYLCSTEHTVCDVVLLFVREVYVAPLQYI